MAEMHQIVQVGNTNQFRSGTAFRADPTSAARNSKSSAWLKALFRASRNRAPSLPGPTERYPRRVCALQHASRERPKVGVNSQQTWRSRSQVPEFIGASLSGRAALYRKQGMVGLDWRQMGQVAKRMTPLIGRAQRLCRIFEGSGRAVVIFFWDSGAFSVGEAKIAQGAQAEILEARGVGSNYVLKE